MFEINWLIIKKIKFKRWECDLGLLIEYFTVSIKDEFVLFDYNVIV